MSMFLFHLLLSYVWALFLPLPLIHGAIIGFCAQYIVFIIFRPLFPNTTYLARLWAAIWFLPYYVVLYIKYLFRCLMFLISPKNGPYSPRLLHLDTPLSHSQQLIIAGLVATIPGAIVIDMTDDVLTIQVICPTKTLRTALRQFEKEFIMPIVRFIS
ncbi:MAG: Na+/H+ antiporter subunit E [bacterium]|nr:Na+/H+ antiporter subunit E [bacterium]